MDITPRRQPLEENWLGTPQIGTGKAGTMLLTALMIKEVTVMATQSHACVHLDSEKVSKLLSLVMAM